MPALQHGTDGHLDRQVLVVGTGLAGLATAAACRERGFDPVVVGGAAPDRSRVLTLWRPAITLVEGLGLSGAVSAGIPVQRWVRRTPCGTADEAFVHEGAPATAPCTRVRRRRVTGALADGLPGGCVRPDRTVHRVEQSRSGPVVTFADGVRERFDVVVGADGPDSRVRAAAADPTVEDGGESSHAEPVTGSFHASPRLSARNTVYEHRTQAGAVTRLGPLAGADVWRHVGPPTVGRSLGTDWWVGPGLALVGAAASPLPPTVTTRDTLALADGATLAGVLASRPTMRAALRTYERRRRNRTERRYGDYRRSGRMSPDSIRACRTAFLREMFDDEAARDGPGFP